MKLAKLTFLTLLFVGTLTVSAEPRGWGVGLGTFEGDWGAQARKDFLIGEQQRHGVVLQGGLYNQTRWTARLDADYHFIFRPESAFRLYPLAGIDLAVQSKNNRAGINLGGGLTLDLNESTRLFLEVKHVFSDWDGLAVTAGIYF